MSRFFCCFKREPTLRSAGSSSLSDSKSHENTRKSVTIASTDQVKDILEKSDQNENMNFHNAISIYEAAMRLQRDIEFAFIHRDHREISLIREIYSSPETYIYSTDEGIRAVARNLQYVQACSDIVSDLEVHASYRDSTRRTTFAHESRAVSVSGINSAVTNPLAQAELNENAELESGYNNHDSDDEDKIEDSDDKDKHLSYNSKLFTDFDGLTATAMSDEISPPSTEVRERRHRNSSRLQLIFDERMGSNDLLGLFQPPLDVINFASRDSVRVTDKGTAITDVSRYSTKTNTNEFGEKTKPVWPDWLVDVKFDCFKVNKMGLRKVRTLLLTEYHILSMRKNSEIRMALKYMDVKKVLFKRPNKLIITNQFDHSMTFNSSAASHILQQIKSRIAARSALEEAGFFYSGLNTSTLKNYTKEQTGAVLNSLEVGFADKMVGDITPRAIEKRVFGPFADALLLIAIKCRVKEAEDVIARNEEEEAEEEKKRIKDEKNSESLKKKQQKEDDDDDDDDDDHDHEERGINRVGQESFAIITNSVGLLDGQGKDTHIDVNDTNNEGENNDENETIIVTRPDPNNKGKRPPRKSVAAGLHKRSLRKSTANSIAQMGIIAEEGEENNTSNEDIQVSNPHNYAENIARKVGANVNTTTVARKLKPWNEDDINSLLTVLPGSQAEKVRQNVQALITESNQTAARAIASFNSKFETECKKYDENKMTNDLLRQVQSLSRGVYEYICQKHWHVIDSKEPSELFDICNKSDSKLGSILCFTVWITIEEVVVGGLEHLITPNVTSSHITERESSISLSHLSYSSSHNVPFSIPSRNVDQSDFDVPELMRSPRGWTNAIISLAGVYADAIPTRRIASLARTVNLIYEEHDTLLQEIKTNNNETPYMGADELVPIFLYCFARASMNHENVMEIISSLWNLTHPSLRQGEVGYLITVLESAAVIYNEEFSSNKKKEQEEQEQEQELEKEIQRRSSVRGSISIAIPNDE